MTEPRKMVFLGALDVEAGETLAIELPADLDPDAVKLAIEKANLERAAEKAAEIETAARIVPPSGRDQGPVMTDTRRRLIEIGVIPSGAELFFEGNIDPAVAVVADGIRKADLARAGGERARLAAALDVERVKATRRAIGMRRLRKALTLIGCYRRLR